MNKSIELVREFHEVFGHPIASAPCVPPMDRVNFRVAFIKEEMSELQAGAGIEDLEEIADGLGDAQYVLDGFILEAGLQDVFPQIMEEIHRSNMSKTCKTEEEAHQTIEKLHTEGKNGICIAKPIGAFWIVYRESDNKVMKSINFSKPNLRQFLK
jgi:predicted HAD superfamily Cof-like phosphohydrolase